MTTPKYKYPVIPETIRIHLGKPKDNSVTNIEIPFKDYIKGVTSSEIYPTWPDSAIRANVLAQISLALNRIYTEWYPAQGYSFDITNSTQFDQAYNPQVSVAENVNLIVDELFNDYVKKGDDVAPFYTEYCNGTTSKCPGLSQWGTVYLAEQGMSPLEILQYYYGNQISIIEDAPVQDVQETYPGTPLKIGSIGNENKLLQTQLNRIRRNFPAIPPLRFVDGVFGVEEENAVKAFQNIFQIPATGVVDKVTWYEIKQKYNAVKKLAELASEGVPVSDLEFVIPEELKLGMVGAEVETIQYYLTAISFFVPTVPSIRIDGIYGPLTEQAVKDFQKAYGLSVTGVIDRPTFDKLQGTYDEVVGTLPESYTGNKARFYPGYILSSGMQNADVRSLQTYLKKIGEVDETIPKVEVTGIFDDATRAAVVEIQKQAGTAFEGIVGASTWNRITERYNNIIAEEEANAAQ